jgi:hypothetical protein
MRAQEQPSPSEGFAFTERERLFNRVSNARFQALMVDPQTQVHSAELAFNRYGEFLYVTVSRPIGTNRTVTTFYGCGFHNERERWVTQEWFWYPEPVRPDIMQHVLAPETVQALLQARRDEIAPDLDQSPQSQRGALFELLADLGDDDGALAEMEDLEALGFDFDGEDDETR